MATTLGQAVTIAASALRDAGFLSYSATDQREAIRFVDAEFARLTRCARAVGTLSLGSGVTTFDPSTISGASPSRIMLVRRDDYRQVEIVNVPTILAWLQRQPTPPQGSGKPCAIAFETDTSGYVFPMTDDDYDLSVLYWQASNGLPTDDALLTIPDTAVKQAIWWGVPAVLRYAGREDVIAALEWRNFVQFCQSIAGDVQTDVGEGIKDTCNYL